MWFSCTAHLCGSARVLHCAETSPSVNTKLGYVHTTSSKWCICVQPWGSGRWNIKSWTSQIIVEHELNMKCLVCTVCMCETNDPGLLRGYILASELIKMANETNALWDDTQMHPYAGKAGTGLVCVIRLSALFFNSAGNIWFECIHCVESVVIVFCVKPKTEKKHFISIDCCFNLGGFAGLQGTEHYSSYFYPFRYMDIKPWKYICSCHGHKPQQTQLSVHSSTRWKIFAP